MTAQAISNEAIDKAMETALKTAAQFKGADVIDYLTGLITASVSMLRAADDGCFVYGFLRSALASLGQSASVVGNPHGGELGVCVHMGASLANPDMLTSIDELRRELHAANDQLTERDIRLADNKFVMQALARDLGKVVIAHQKKDALLLKQTLDEFCGKHVRVSTGSESVH